MRRQLAPDALSRPAPELAAGIVDRFEADRVIVPGIGHPFHKPLDPRTPRLLEIARQTGFDVLGAHQPKGTGMQPEPHLVGERGAATGAI